MFKVKIWKNKKGGISRCLVCDLGYREAFVSWDSAFLAEVLGMSMGEFAYLPEGVYPVVNK